MSSQSIRLAGPGDIVGMVPYLVGFYPTEAVVALLIRSGTVMLTMRVDMPSPDEAVNLAALIGRLSDQHGAEQLVVIGYGSHAESARQVLTTVAAEVDSGALRDLLLVHGRRWWSLICAGSCCGEDGQPYDPGSSSVAAEAVYAGLRVLPDRRALEREVSGPSSGDHNGLRRLAEQQSAVIGQLDLPARSDLIRSLVEHGLDQSEPVDDATCARMAVLVSEVAVRDVALALITRAQAEQHLQLWARVVSRTTAPLEAAPLCLLGFCAWVCGNGAMMNCCIERLSAIDPGCSLALLLDKISKRALPPSLWDELRSEICREVPLATK
jgi:Domain of unknown function (DUF4192)